MPRLPPMSVSHVGRAAITFPPQVASIVKLVGITIVRRRSKPGRYQQLITTAQSDRSRIFREISQKKMIPGTTRNCILLHLSRTAWHRTCQRHETGLASIVSAGTADAFVTHEVARTLEYLGWTVRLFEDCGVAGLWRIQAARDDINKGDVVVVCAGLDAALASVMGGLTSKPVFAVPTSVGYGIAEGGRAALSSCLASCAPGVAVMNIDNGYGAACAAARVLTLLESVRAAR